MHVKTFSDFLKSKVETTLDKAPKSYIGEGPAYDFADWTCFVYMDTYVIEKAKVGFILNIRGEEHNHTDLQELERKLYSEVHLEHQCESASLLAAGQILMLKNMTVAELSASLQDPNGDMDFTLIELMENLGVHSGAAARYILVEDKLISLLNLYFPT